jgi:ZIP family zinc transporter
MKMDISQLWMPLLLTSLAGIATGIGGLVALFIRKLRRCYLCFSLGLSAGVMIYVSFTELLAGAVENIGFLLGNLAFFTGILFILAVDSLVPHEYIEEHVKQDIKHRKIWTVGVLTAFGIAIHNFPEGLAVFMSSLTDINLGIALAVAIAIHNIPEGIAVAMPIFYATKSRATAFWYSLLAGIAEPVGAVIGFLVLLPFLSPTVLSLMLAFVAGIMVFISFDELLPLSFEKGGVHLSIFGFILGMAIMALSLYLL